MIYFCVFDLSPKDKETMLKSTGNDKFKETIRNLEYIDPALAISDKFARKHPV
jgi:hypothetical protein